MPKIAICNVSGFGREFPEFLTELEQKVGPVQKFSFDPDIDSKELARRWRGLHMLF